MTSKEDDCCCCGLEDIWYNYKYKIIKYSSIVMSGIGGATIALNGHFAIPTYVFGSILNVGILVSGLAIDELATQNKNVHEENKSLQNAKNDMVRKYTIAMENYKFPESTTPNLTPKSDTTEPFQEVVQLAIR